MTRKCISEAEWLDYVGGTLDRARADAIRQHVSGCEKCAQALPPLAHWHEVLEQEGAQLRQDCAVSEREMDRMVAHALERIRAEAPLAPRAWNASERKFLLRSLMEPIFGAGTARITVDLAVLRSTTVDEDALTGANWKLFVANLSEAVSSICGSAAGRLVDRVGLGLAVEEA